MVDEVKILNPGDTAFQGRRHGAARRDAEKANTTQSPRRSSRAEIEAHCDYLSAWEEDKYIIAQANVELDEKGQITAELVNARQAGNFVLKHARRNRVHGRQSEAARLGRRQPDSVP